MLKHNKVASGNATETLLFTLLLSDNDNHRLFFLFLQKCADHRVSDKRLYPTFARTFPPATQVTRSIISLLLHFNWRKFTLVVGTSSKWQSIAEKVGHFRAHSHCAFFFLNETAIPLIAMNGLHRTQRKCSHCAIAKTSPVDIQPIVSKNKSQSQVAQCDRALRLTGRHTAGF